MSSRVWKQICEATVFYVWIMKFIWVFGDSFMIFYSLILFEFSIFWINYMKKEEEEEEEEAEDN